LPAPRSAEALEQLKGLTPSRIVTGRTGTRYLTKSYLGLRADHAIALDAVESEIEDGWAEQQGWLPLRSRAKDHAEFLLHPDNGRRLDEASRQRCEKDAERGLDVQLIAGDGLSANALRLNGPALLTSLCGAALGAVMLDAIDASILSRAMPVLLIAIALYFALAPSAENLPREARLTPSAFAIGLAAPIGFYDGIFGPGTGSFFTAALVVFAGLGLLKATAHTKALNLASNIASLAVFMLSGHLLYAVGLPMAVGQMAGARLGAGAAITHGARLIRPLIVLVTIAIAIRLLMR
jgi:hypothetical protein